ncbi:hypothetical protein [Roseateles sp.]|uniref:hypothetical protein n=1 Tax=Roseateles sp. TaxID=1971397 RepID=UPI002E08F2F7|nr:hypothetical protein [Roseateles sp.]
MKPGLAARWLLRACLIALPVLLVAGVFGGLLRAGAAPAAVGGDWLAAAATGHAFLVICAFMGTVIAIERAVALRHVLGFAGPAASAGAGLAWLAGAPMAAAGMALAAALAFVAVNAVIIRRQPAPHTVVLGLGALCWAVGGACFAGGAGLAAVLPWWLAFLVLTIAAERLEMTRLARRRAGAAETLYAIVALLLAGAAASALPGPWGGLLYGLALAALAAWLVAFDIARRTVRAHGLSRYMAVCLLLGYGWLFVAGAAWVAAAFGHPARDAALHGLALGFVMGMVFAHAPVILPAIARIKVLFGWPFYLPLAGLHASLLLRLAGGAASPHWLAAGAAGNALALAAFAAMLAGAALAWRLKAPDGARKTLA